MKNILLGILCSLINTISFAQINGKMEETVIVFLQPEDTLFQNQVLPELTQFAIEKGMKLALKNTDAGVPENMTTTPAIVYQNYKGRSIYSSRYMEFSTIKNFIRTSRVIPQAQVENRVENALIWAIGRAKIAALLKITEVAGELPKDFSQANFKQKAAAILEKNMVNFKVQAAAFLEKTDRRFYLDLHPYHGGNDDFYLSLEVYSQYSCKVPIFTKMATPLKGKFSNWEAVLMEAATLLDGEIICQMQQSKIGDAFSPIGINTINKRWEDLDLGLPQPPEKAILDSSKIIEMPPKWTFYQAIDDATPIVQFRFMAPLDGYIGEIQKMTGDLQFIDNQNIVKGFFIAEMQSLTMGMESFDYNVLNKYVKAYKIPESSFEFETSEVFPVLTFGETTQFSVEGRFELMRKKRPVRVNAMLTPLIDEVGKPVLQVNASFSLNVVDDFGIKGPDGPNPARKTMLFDLNFLMQ